MVRIQLVTRVSVLLTALFIIGAVGRTQAQDYVPGEVLVKFKAGPFSGGRETARIGAWQIGVVRGVGVSRLRLPRGMSVEAAVAHFSRLPSVEFAEPNGIFRLLTEPNDPSFVAGQQWSLAKIRAPEAWSITIGSSSVKVAVLDTGVNLAHSDLAGKVVLTKDLTVSDGVDDVNDVNGHGTHTAGTVAADTNNAIGVASLGWETRLMIGKVVMDNGTGILAEVAAGIDWATENGAKVISMSVCAWKGFNTLKVAVDNAWNRGVVLVAAAGNGGERKPAYPGAYENCISVAATDQNDAKAGFSNYGSWIDCAAPGVSILSTTRSGGYASWSGTSMATPHVAALAALLWTTEWGTSAASVRDRILITGVTVTNGFGAYPTKRIDAFAAVAP